uniref:Ig-like domain-containing protein n=1 Tax=Electrophorus electricus TaxID=8005 RepID=A0A4W4EWK3_ELEEL
MLPSAGCCAHWSVPCTSFSLHLPISVATQTQKTLVCLVSKYSPSAINITWLKGSEVVQHNRPLPAKDATGKFMVQSRLQLRATDWKAETTYTCQVDHITGTVIHRISKEGDCLAPKHLFKVVLDFH